MKKYYIIISILLSLLYISCEEFILGPDPGNTPENNFNILWSEFDRYYPSFIIKRINWDSLHSVYHSQVTLQTTEDELWDIITSMLFHFNDIHVFMYNNNGTQYFSSSHNYYRFEFSLPLIKYKYLNNRFETAGEGNFTYGRFPGDTIGYLYIKTFHGNDVWSKDIDDIITELSDVKAMVIDVRDNNGGYDYNFEYIASVFTDKPVTYCQEKTRNGPNHNNFTPPVFRTIKPRSKSPLYNNRIIFLTNGETSSAGELFTLIFKQLSYSEQIGDFTKGGLGRVRGFQLTNGWLYYMPISLNFTVEGQSLENIGVAPDIYVRNSEYEIYQNYDRQLEFTLEYLSKK